MPLKPPGVANAKFNRDPFGPSLDRITPKEGYVKGNLRIVTNMANSAMNEWGFRNFLIFMSYVSEDQLKLGKRLDFHFGPHAPLKKAA